MRASRVELLLAVFEGELSLGRIERAGAFLSCTTYEDDMEIVAVVNDKCIYYDIDAVRLFPSQYI